MVGLNKKLVAIMEFNKEISRKNKFISSLYDKLLNVKTHGIPKDHGVNKKISQNWLSDDKIFIGKPGRDIELVRECKDKIQEEISLIAVLGTIVQWNKKAYVELDEKLFNLKEIVNVESKLQKDFNALTIKYNDLNSKFLALEKEKASQKLVLDSKAEEYTLLNKVTHRLKRGLLFVIIVGIAYIAYVEDVRYNVGTANTEGTVSLL